MIIIFSLFLASLDLQVLMLQEKLEEKGQESQRLKGELQQKGYMEDGRTEALSNRKNTDEIILKEDANWYHVNFKYFFVGNS